MKKNHTFGAQITIMDVNIITSNNWGGRIPPKDTEVEKSVLGSMLYNKQAVEVAVGILEKEMFYEDRHSIVFDVIKEMYSEGTPVDLMSAANILRKEGQIEAIGGLYYLTQLTSSNSGVANVEHHCKILVEKHVQREIIRISQRAVDEAFNETGDVFALLDRSEEALFSIKDQSIKKSHSKIDGLVAEAIKKIESIKTSDGGCTGVPSGFSSLDKVTGGWQNSDLIILAGRPGSGKSSMALNMARNAAINFDIPVAIFSLEMSSLQLTNKLISSETGISSESMRNGQLTEQEWVKINTETHKLSGAPIYIDDTAQLSIFDLKAKARRLKSNQGVGMIVIDYLQLMTADMKGKGNREQEVSHISRALKGLAKELDIPVIALAQLSRAVEQRNDKRPLLSDLRESGSLEQDPDLVCFLYRPDYYGITTDEAGNDTTGLTEIILGKNRHGKTGKVNLRFDGDTTTFEDWELREFNPNIQMSQADNDQPW